MQCHAARRVLLEMHNLLPRSPRAHHTDGIPPPPAPQFFFQFHANTVSVPPRLISHSPQEPPLHDPAGCSRLSSCVATAVIAVTEAFSCCVVARMRSLLHGDRSERTQLLWLIGGRCLHPSSDAVWLLLCEGVVLMMMGDSCPSTRLVCVQ